MTKSYSSINAQSNEAPNDGWIQIMQGQCKMNQSFQDSCEKQKLPQKLKKPHIW